MAKDSSTSTSADETPASSSSGPETGNNGDSSTNAPTPTAPPTAGQTFGTVTPVPLARTVPVTPAPDSSVASPILNSLNQIKDAINDMHEHLTETVRTVTSGHANGAELAGTMLSDVSAARQDSAEIRTAVASGFNELRAFLETELSTLRAEFQNHRPQGI